MSDYPGMTTITIEGAHHMCPLPFGEQPAGLVLRCDTCGKVWRRVSKGQWEGVRADFCEFGHYVPR